MSNEIHPTAIISSKAELGDNISIGPYTVVEGDVVIGSGTQLGPHVYCADGARIGKECRIHKGAVVATLPQDLKFKNEKTTFEIGDATTIGSFARSTADRRAYEIDGRQQLLVDGVRSRCPRLHDWR